MIEKLFIGSDDYREIPPSKYEIIDKINEIIDWINNQEEDNNFKKDLINGMVEQNYRKGGKDESIV